MLEGYSDKTLERTQSQQSGAASFFSPQTRGRKFSNVSWALNFVNWASSRTRPSSINSELSRMVPLWQQDSVRHGTGEGQSLGHLRSSPCTCPLMGFPSEKKALLSRGWPHHSPITSSPHPTEVALGTTDGKRDHQHLHHQQIRTRSDRGICSSSTCTWSYPLYK